MILLGYALSIGYIVLVFLITWACIKLFHIKEESSRKLVHISIGFMWPIMYLTLRGTLHFALIPIGALFLFFMVSKSKLFSIMTREQGDSLFGIMLYIISIVIMSSLSLVFPSTVVAYGLGVFAMTFGDGFAALIGKRFGKYTPKILGEKTVAGSIACVLFTFLGMTFILAIVCCPVNVPKLLVLSFATAILELCSGKWDNLTIPLCVMGMAWVFGM